MRPRPVQRPHPPLYIAANSEDSVHSAARLGLPTLSSFFVPIEELQRRHQLYREESRGDRAIGRRGGDAGAPGVGDASGARRALLARKRCAPSRPRSWATSGRCRSCAPTPPAAPCPARSTAHCCGSAPSAEYLDDGWALIGTPDEVREGLQKYLDATGYQHVLLLMALPGLDTSLALRSMRLFAEQVAPAMVPANGRVATGP